jgi:hypothetical protein
MFFSRAYSDVGGESIQLLKATGAALFGPRWKAALASHIGVTRETVSRWCNGRAALPEWALFFIQELVKARGAVLSLCDRTGNMVEPWARAGFDCIAVDIRHTGMEKRGGITFTCADVRYWLPPPRRYAIVFAFPHCTHLAVSGARWFQEKGMNGLTEAVEVVEACRRICEWSEAPWMIENPVSTLSSYWRRPDFFFDPCDYGGWLQPPGDHYAKKTSVWTGNGFRRPEKRRVEALHTERAIHNLPRTPDRGDICSITPPGFAQAVFAANSAYPRKMAQTQHS